MADEFWVLKRDGLLLTGHSHIARVIACESEDDAWDEVWARADGVPDVWPGISPETPDPGWLPVKVV